MDSVFTHTLEVVQGRHRGGMLDHSPLMRFSQQKEPNASVDGGFLTQKAGDWSLRSRSFAVCFDQD